MLGKRYQLSEHTDREVPTKVTHFYEIFLVHVRPCFVHFDKFGKSLTTKTILISN